MQTECGRNGYSLTFSISIAQHRSFKELDRSTDSQSTRRSPVNGSELDAESTDDSEYIRRICIKQDLPPAAGDATTVNEHPPSTPEDIVSSIKNISFYIFHMRKGFRLTSNWSEGHITLACYSACRRQIKSFCFYRWK